MYCIYKITDLRTDEIIYIGKTKDFNSRRIDHFKDKRRPIDKHMLDQGRDNFEMMKIQDNIETNEEAVKIENQFIVEFNTIMNKQRSGNISKDDLKSYMREYHKSEKYKEYQRQYRLKKKQEKLAANSNFFELL